MTDPELLRLLRCPETRQPLAVADETVIRSLNDRISAGVMRNRGGETVLRPCDSGLVRQDGRYLYPIREAIPEMLIAEAMPLGLRDEVEPAAMDDSQGRN